VIDVSAGKSLQPRTGGAFADQSAGRQGSGTKSMADGRTMLPLTYYRKPIATDAYF